MTRDNQQFPPNDNGDILWQMQQAGDKLDIPRDIEFTVAFVNEDEAIKFGEVLLANRQKILLSDVEGQRPFEILVTVNMLPNYEDISGYQALLESHAAPLNGINDGWGCFSKG